MSSNDKEMSAPKAVYRDAVASALCAKGYNRITKSNLRTIAHEGVEHWLGIDFHGHGGCYLYIYYGLRNQEAERFSSACMRNIGCLAFEKLEYRVNGLPYMSYALGRLAGWNPFSSVDLRLWTPVEAAEIACQAVDDVLSNAVKSITSPVELVGVLRSDNEPYTWVYINGVMRTAQIVFLSRRLKLEYESMFDDAQFNRTKLESVFVHKKSAREIYSMILDEYNRVTQ